MGIVPIKCRIHPKESLRRMSYHKNSRVVTDWYFCEKCGKPYKMDYSIRTVEEIGERIAQATKV